MINLINGALYYSSHSLFHNIISTIVSIIIFVAVCAYCSNTEPSDNTSSKTTKKYNSNSSFNPSRSYYSDDECMQTNYDPTWDDAYFEKTGIEPWFDDNPWDHEKK